MRFSKRSGERTYWPYSLETPLVRKVVSLVITDISLLTQEAGEQV